MPDAVTRFFEVILDENLEALPKETKTLIEIELRRP